MTDAKKKLDLLKESSEKGIVNAMEYEKAKQEIKEKPKGSKPEENREDAPEEPRSSEKILLVSVAAIIVILAAIFAFSSFRKEEPRTLDEMHVLNLKGKLKPEQGYVYKGAYSFVFFDGVWYSQLQSPGGTKVYSLALRYSPRELENITIEGAFDADFFNNKSEFYVTFNPTGKEFSYVALAVADFNTHMSKVFEKNPIAACDRNETEVCRNRPIVTCDDKDKIVFYVKEADIFRVYYNDNCIVVEGQGLDLVRGVDRILYNLYNIMGQEEA